MDCTHTHTRITVGLRTRGYIALRFAGYTRYVYTFHTHTVYARAQLRLPTVYVCCAVTHTELVTRTRTRVTRARGHRWITVQLPHVAVTTPVARVAFRLPLVVAVAFAWFTRYAHGLQLHGLRLLPADTVYAHYARFTRLHVCARLFGLQLERCAYHHAVALHTVYWFTRFTVYALRVGLRYHTRLVAVGLFTRTRGLTHYTRLRTDYGYIVRFTVDWIIAVAPVGPDI